MNIEFTRKGESIPTPLNEVIEELYGYLGLPINNYKYVEYWLDIITSEMSIEECSLDSVFVRDRVVSLDIPEVVNMLDYLQENYTARTWRSPWY